MLKSFTVGALLGGLLGAVPMGPALYSRLTWSLSGGGGEKADWGEPAFFMLLMMVPAANIGGVLGVVFTAAVRRFRQKPPNTP